MSSPNKIREEKINALSLGFSKLGYKGPKSLGRKEYSLFLNKRSKSGQFNETLLEKLFHFLSLDKKSYISIEDFILGFLQLEEDLRKNADLFKIKFAREQAIYSNILNQYRKYQLEKLNPKGFCENSKVYGEITDINIKKKLEGIKEIIIIILYNNSKEEMHFKIGDINNNEKFLNKKFEFKPTSRKDHFEFIMKGINNRDQIFDIGSRLFPLDNVDSQEEYLVQIIIPEIDNPDQIAAYIHTKIILYWSDFKQYESLKKKQEKRLQKYSAAANQATEYLKMIREIYGDLSHVKPEIIIDINNEKLMRRKSPEININFRNSMIVKGKELDDNYYVEFNNQRKIARKKIRLRVDFYNSKNDSNPYALTQCNKCKYKLSNNVSQEIINKADEILNKLLPIEKDFNNINQKIKSNLNNNGNLNPNLKHINIKRTTKIYKNDKKEKTPYSQSKFSLYKNPHNHKFVQNNSNVKFNDFPSLKIDSDYNQNQSPTKNQINQRNLHIYNQSKNNFKSNNVLFQQNNSHNSNLAQTQYKTQYENFNNEKEIFHQQIIESRKDINNSNIKNQNQKITNYEYANNYNITDKEIKNINSNKQNMELTNNKDQCTTSSNRVILNNGTINKGMKSENTISISNLPEKINTNIDDNNAINLQKISKNNNNNYNIPKIYFNDSDNLNNNINNSGNINNNNNITFSNHNISVSYQNKQNM